MAQALTMAALATKARTPCPAWLRDTLTKALEIGKGVVHSVSPLDGLASALAEKGHEVAVFIPGYRAALGLGGSWRLHGQWHVVHEGGQRFNNGAVRDSQAAASSASLFSVMVSAV